MRTSVTGPLALSLACIAVVVAGPLAVAADGLADVGGTADIEARIAALEGRMSDLDDDAARTRAQIVSYLPAPAPAGDCGPCEPPVGQDFVCGRCRTSGLYGGAEIMWLRPFASGFSPVVLDAASADEFLPGWRLWGGYQNADGLGWRVSWWQWDQFSSGTGSFFSSNAAADIRLVFQKLDLMATQLISFRRWDLMMLGGVTYAGNAFNTNLTNPDNPANFYTTTSRFDGWGLTAGLLAYRDVPWLANVKGYGGIQWSGVYGNSNLSQKDSADPVENIDINGTMLNILELRVGAQYERRIGRGAIGFVSGGFEAQYWTGFGSSFFDELALLTGGDVGLVGFTLGTGIRR